ncbi:MAG: ABC transporter permease [Candidatus Avelusimicrobium sp.]|uniref:ABC transporter permease n=1 Tax=Candidatus Avelusimicrobium sp. TaxID=3048833 RepID=UPI003EFFBDE2
MKTIIRPILSIASKETKHIRRDPFTLAVALLLPLLFVWFFGFVINLDYHNIPLLVRDNDQSRSSRELLMQAGAAGYFDVVAVHSPAEAEKALQKNSMKGLLIIPPGFHDNLTRGDTARAQLLVDGSDNTLAALMNMYMQGISATAQQALTTPRASAPNMIRTRYLFNPELNSRWFIVPALSTVIIGFLAIILTALTVAREWENGSMELLLSTPVRPFEIVLGKLLPYFALSFFDALLVFALALIVFHIPFMGSFLLYLLACTLFIIGSLALGLLISVLTRQQQAAIQFGFAIGLLPSFMFSGFIFPIENMPLFFRWFTGFFPQRWFLSLSRSLFLTEAGFKELAGPFAALFIFMFVMVALAVKKFKTDVEP